ncbi:HlyD family type I secretion periplasmic adaptor subunit [Allorhizobium undicola]|uniref:HlyD family type I secretion periplasmic adaptor subunit n=1 Tax=Allorhizobium undicola TaxID=78527 RepID=UPI0006884332|nr:HlyD family type I secretion periplasmic adaptor subunit [Allorhizobium undicola]
MTNSLVLLSPARPVRYNHEAELLQTSTSIRKNFLRSTVLGAALLFGLVGWAATTDLSGAVIASGRVIIEGNAKKIQHQAGGTVSEILVKDGDHVAADQVLFRLDGNLARVNQSIVRNALAQFYVRRARLQAEITKAPEMTMSEDLTRLVAPETAQLLLRTERNLFDSRRNAQEAMKQQLTSRQQQLLSETDGLRSQVTSYNEQLELLSDEIQKAQSMLSQGLTTLERVNTRKRQKAELEGNKGQIIAALAQAQGKLSEIDLQLLQTDEERSTEVSNDLTTTEAKVSEYEERETAARNLIEQLEVRAPTSGTIHELAIRNVGAVVQPGEVVMMIVPDKDKLEIETRIEPRDVDQVHLGQQATIRFTAFNQNTTPTFDGQVAFIAPDLHTDEHTGKAYYVLRVGMDEQAAKKLSSFGLYPGMPSEVYLKTEERNVLSYFVKPFEDRLQNVFRSE